jgi:hypothetical protein
MFGRGTVTAAESLLQAILRKRQIAQAFPPPLPPSRDGVVGIDVAELVPASHHVSDRVLHLLLGVGLEARLRVPSGAMRVSTMSSNRLSSVFAIRVLLEHAVYQPASFLNERRPQRSSGLSQSNHY